MDRPATEAKKVAEDKEVEFSRFKFVVVYWWFDAVDTGKKVKWEWNYRFVENDSWDMNYIWSGGLVVDKKLKKEIERLASFEKK